MKIEKEIKTKKEIETVLEINLDNEKFKEDLDKFISAIESAFKPVVEAFEPILNAYIENPTEMISEDTEYVPGTIMGYDKTKAEMQLSDLKQGISDLEFEIEEIESCFLPEAVHKNDKDLENKLKHKMLNQQAKLDTWKYELKFLQTIMDNIDFNIELIETFETTNFSKEIK